MKLDRALKARFEQLPHSVLLQAYHAWFVATRGLRFNLSRRVESIPPLTTAAIQSRKSCDTVFILGSGSSINEISDDRWATIKQCDSFGFNFWLAHEHVPAVYAFELMGTNENPIFDKFLQLTWRRDDYRDVCKIYSNSNPRKLRRLPSLVRQNEFWDPLPPWWRNECYTSMAQGLFARDDDELRSAIRFLKGTGLFDCGAQFERLLKYRGTVSLMVHLAAKMGYRDIVLCGIDLNHARYFYEDENRYPNMSNFRSSRQGKVHSTAEERQNVCTIHEVLVALRDLVIEPAGSKLWVENASSALHPDIPVTSESFYLDRSR